MKKRLSVMCLALCLAGCARFHSVQERTLTDGSKETTRVTITTFFDAHSEVSKLKTTATDKTQGISLGSVTENTSGTNSLELLKAVGGILQAIPK